MENLYITKKFIADEQFTELDFQLKDSFGFDEEKHIDMITIEKGQPKWGPYTFPIEIDQLIEFLQKSKKSGATHIEMDYHEDHIGYDFATFQITKSSGPDIDMYERELEEEEEEYKSRKKADLYRQLRDLED